MRQIPNQLDRWQIHSVPVDAYLLRYWLGLLVALVAAAVAGRRLGLIWRPWPRPSAQAAALARLPVIRA